MFKKNYINALTQQFDKPNTFSNLSFVRTNQQVRKANLKILDFCTMTVETLLKLSPAV